MEQLLDETDEWREKKRKNFLDSSVLFTIYEQKCEKLFKECFSQTVFIISKTKLFAQQMA